MAGFLSYVFFFLILFLSSRICPKLATSFLVRQHVHIGKGLVAYYRGLALSSIHGQLPSFLNGGEVKKRSDFFEI